MAVKERKKKKRVEAPEQPTEQQRVADWRRDQFKKQLPGTVSDRQIQGLVDSASSPHDLAFLLKRGCPAKFAVRILT